MTQEEVWDKIAEPWSKFRRNPPIEVIEFLKNKKGKVLDLGCGSGRNLIKNDKINYYAVDFSKGMLELARVYCEKSKIKALFFKSGAEEIPFKSNFFDSAIFISALHCIEKKNDRKKSLKEFYRVLKKDAEALITVWNKGETKQTKSEKQDSYINWQKEGKDYLRYYYFYKEKELISLIKSVGFKIIKIETNESKSTIGQHSKKNILVYVKK